MFWSKQNLAQKTSGSKIIFGKKIFGSNKNFGAKKLLVKKKFGSQKIFGAKKICLEVMGGWQNYQIQCIDIPNL